MTFDGDRTSIKPLKIARDLDLIIVGLAGSSRLHKANRLIRNIFPFPDRIYYWDSPLLDE